MKHEQKLSDALRQVCESENSKFIEELEINDNISFSPEYKAEIQALTENMSKEKYSGITSLVKWTATAAAVMVIIVSTVMINIHMKNNAPGFNSLQTEDIDDFTINTTDGNEIIVSVDRSNKLSGNHFIYDLPDGFEQTDLSETEMQRTVTYKNGDDYITLEQSAAKYFVAVHPVDKYNKNNYIDKNGTEYVTYTSLTDKYTEIIWMDNGNVMRIMCSLNIYNALDLCKSTKIELS